MPKSTPYDEDAPCQKCGGSMYFDHHIDRLICEDCGHSIFEPDPDRQLEDLMESRRLRQEYPDPPDEG